MKGDGPGCSPFEAIDPANLIWCPGQHLLEGHNLIPVTAIIMSMIEKEGKGTVSTRNITAVCPTS